ncbi:MAG TPA: hypothetical protein VGD63_21535 [Steroidobacteraceae bacterium]
MNGRLTWVTLGLSLALSSGTIHSQTNEDGYSPANLYNLANSYARQGKLGMAVLNYERASLLSPNDPDIEANLKYVRAASHVPDPSRSAFDRVARTLSPFAVSWIGIVGLLLVGLSVLAGQLSQGRAWKRRAAFAVGVPMLALTVCNGIALWPTLHEGVVIGAATPVRVSPVPMGDSLFVLPAAETVRINAEHEGFLLIKTRSGQTGWVSRSAVARVIPLKQ